MKISDNDKKWLMIGGGALVVLLVVRYATAAKTDSTGSSYDPTGNGSSGTTNTANFNASTVAETLYNAMKEMGTDEDAIINALKTVSPSQFQQVIAKFGNRSYNTTLGNQYTLTPWGTLPLLGLNVWLKNELSDDQYNIIRLKYQTLNYLT